mmetsp:Transcript_27276/g.49546  ORF Transcript_27276/g.49546 Transcript_27276/m.49546 type:complete len:490 (+) Transcript_27276:40-1509(+)
MDHLKTHEQRQERWYAKDVITRYVRVRVKGDDEAYRKSSCERGEQDNAQDDDENDVVWGIPASCLVVNEAATKDKCKHILGGKQLRWNMETYGFAVVTGALSIDDCSQALHLAWDFVEAASDAEQFLQQTKESPMCSGLDDGSSFVVPTADTPTKNTSCDYTGTATPVRRDERETHSSRFFPRSVEGGIFPYYGSGHSSFQWFIRSHPAVLSTFAAVYDVQDESQMLTSLDGIVLWRDGEEHKTDAGWFHIDQNPRQKPGFEAVQGLVNLLSVTPNTGGNVLVSKSHRFFPHHYRSKNENAETEGDEDLCQEFYRNRLDEIDGDDWLEIDPNDKNLLHSDAILSILLGPGDILLWDSRVVHCSSPGNTHQPLDDCHAKTDILEKDDQTLRAASHGLIRAASLVSMMPQSRVDDECVLRSRMDAVQSGRTLTHWVNKGAPLGEERPDEVEKEISRVQRMRERQNHTGVPVLLSKEHLTDKQIQMVGLPRN